MSKKILFIVGSLREGSFNHQMALELKGTCWQAEVSYLDYSAIPLFSQDLEVPTLPAVAAAREAVQATDAIWIFSPVYNFSIPGTVKTYLTGFHAPLTYLTLVEHLLFKIKLLLYHL